MQGSFDSLWELLLRGGVGRRHARRYLAELRDHLDDLIAEERQEESGSQSAEPRALARLGSVDMLAAAMISRREALAWSRKAPVATYLLAPPLALAVGTTLAMAGVVMACAWFRSAGGVPSDLPSWFKAFSYGVVFFCNAMLPALLGWTLGVMAIRQRSWPFWPVFGIVVLAAVGAAVQLVVTLPSATGHGEIEIARSFGPLVSDWAALAGRLALNLALTLMPYMSVSLWREVQARRQNK